MAIAYVNGGTGRDTASDTTLNLSAFDVVAGNAIIVGAESYTGGGAILIDHISDTAGNIYSRCGDPESADAFANHDQEIWIAPNAAVQAGNVITVTYVSAATFRNCLACQYSGLKKSNPYDVAAAILADPGATNTHTTNLTDAINQSEELIFAFYLLWGGSAEAFSVSGDNNLRDNIATIFAAVDQIVSSTGQKSVTLLTANPNQLVSMVRTFKAESFQPAWAGYSNILL